MPMMLQWRDEDGCEVRFQDELQTSRRADRRLWRAIATFNSRKKRHQNNFDQGREGTE